MRVFYWITLIISVIGGVNWGMVGIFNIDLVATMLGEMTMMARMIYIVVALSSVAQLLLNSGAYKSLFTLNTAS